MCFDSFPVFDIITHIFFSILNLFLQQSQQFGFSIRIGSFLLKKMEVKSRKDIHGETSPNFSSHGNHGQT